MYINDFAAYSTYIRFDAVKRMISNNKHGRNKDAEYNQ